MQLKDFIKDEFTNVDDWYVHSFQHIDDGYWMPKMSTFEAEITNYSIVCSRLELLFKRAGWEGDGDFQVMYVPPFIVGDGTSHGLVLIHVKQSNNGTSYIASPCELTYKDLNIEISR